MDQPLKEKYLSSGPGGLRKPRILVVPLDWGLGHATRCIPVIKELLRQNCDVWLAGEGAQEELLRLEFPGLPFLALIGYRVRYSRSAMGLLLSIFRQTHKILTAIKKENAWLKEIVQEHDIDAVISDNRYGLYHPAIPSIFITHQLSIKSPLGKWTEKILQKRNYHYINRFTECWVPDTAGNNNLAGELSHPQKVPDIPVKYIGILSRFDFKNIPGKIDHLMVILSGPEPQRTLLEEKIINEISHYPGTATIVRGLPGLQTFLPSSSMIRFYNHLAMDELNKEIETAEFVISRSGYSTIMDIVKLRKKSILVPTPGQAEQEYLGNYLLERQIALSVSQKDFSLTPALQKARQFSYWHFVLENEDRLQGVISGFIEALFKK
jgi:uncharacterized protein (TIGR00661 family)